MMVEDVLTRGDIIKITRLRASSPQKRKVYKIVDQRDSEKHHLDHETIIVVPVDAEPLKDGTYPTQKWGWLHRCLVREGHIVKMGWYGDVTTIIEKTGEAAGQRALQRWA